MSRNISKLSGRKGLKDNLFKRMISTTKKSDNGKQIKQLAEEYHVGMSTIHGAESFYEFLRPEHKEKKAWVCNGSACMCAGNQDNLKEKLVSKLGKDKVGEMFCLGHCYDNTSFHYDGHNYSGKDIDQIDEIIKGKKINTKNINSVSHATKSILMGEFVSANPTGPLHVGHCRGAVLGDVITNLLIFDGNDVTKEYYVNDQGNQVKNFILSVYYRINEILYSKEFPKNHKDLYPGEYVLDIAKKIIDKKLINEFDNFENIYEQLKEVSIKESLELIKFNLNSLGIHHDHFVFESQLFKNNEILNTIEKLKKKDFIYHGKISAPESKEKKNWKERKQLLFKSTMFGDDKDRPLQKDDSSWTYFAGDLAYHNNKIERNFDILINILGADHAGYINRINAGVEALSNKKVKLNCKVSQLVKLLKDGKPFKMSKRKGDYITVEDLINEVGRDPVRFIMLSRSNDVELDFDFKKVTEKTKDNPVYYVQYCYARICSVFRNLNKDLNEEINFDKKIFNINSYERQIIKKLSEWPKCISISTQRMEPHRIPVYLYELASLFHSYWNLGKDNISFRFINDNKPTSLTKLIILKCISYVVKSGMNLIGVNTPSKM